MIQFHLAQKVKEQAASDGRADLPQNALSSQGAFFSCPQSAGVFPHFNPFYDFNPFNETWNGPLVLNRIHRRFMRKLYGASRVFVNRSRVVFRRLDVRG